MFKALKARLVQYDGYVALLLLAVCAAVVFWHPLWGSLQADEPSAAVADASIEIGRTQLGAESAPLVLMVFSDFQCPFCRTFATTVLPELDARLIRPGKLRVRFVSLPLTSIHPLAYGAAIAATCAEAQGKFREYHDSLFSDPARLDPDSLTQRATALALQRQDFDNCVGRKADGKVERDVRESERFSIASTPTFFLGAVSGEHVRVAKVFTGVRSAVEFEKAFARIADGLARAN